MKADGIGWTLLLTYQFATTQVGILAATLMFGNFKFNYITMSLLCIFSVSCAAIGISES